MSLCVATPGDLICGLRILVVEEENAVFIHIRETACHFETKEEFPTTVGVKLSLAEWHILEKYRHIMLTNIQQNAVWHVDLSDEAFTSTTCGVYIFKEIFDTAANEALVNRMNICCNHWRALINCWNQVTRLIEETKIYLY